MLKSDLLDFPNQTAVSFWIIVLVILGVMIAGAVGPSPILMWPTTLTILILPVRALLAWPDREIKKRQDTTATHALTESGVLLRLQTALTTLATDHGYHEPVKIIIGGTTDKMNAVGSWRRHYLMIGKEVAQQLDTDLQNPTRLAVAEAALLHEIAHFLHRDVQRVGYTRELLRSSVIVILWWMFFLLGWLGFMGQAGQAFLDLKSDELTAEMPSVVGELFTAIVTLPPDERAEIVNKVETISIELVLNYVANAFSPIIWMAFFLWLFFWRRMLRLQEHYADCFVKSVLEQPDALYTAWQNYEPQSLIITQAQPTLLIRLNEIWHSLWFKMVDSLPVPTSAGYQRIAKQLTRLRQWFRYHPTIEQRKTFLVNPQGIYESWQSVALTTLALVLALEVLLITPLASYHTGTYIIHFPTLIIFVLLGTWALPFAVQQQAVWLSLCKSLMLIYGVRWAWIALNFGLILFLAIVAPNYARSILNSVAFAGGRFAGNPSSLPVNNALDLTLSIIPSYLGLQLLSLGVVVLLLFIYLRLQRRAAPFGQPVNWQRRHRWLILTLTVAALTLVLTPLSDVLQGEADLIFRPVRLVSYAVGVVCVLWLLLESRRAS